jgi:hypothetical protein
MAIERIASHTEWQRVRIWDSPDGRWNAAAVKERAGGDLDALRFHRPTKDEACAALLKAIKHIDAEDRREARREQDNAALGAAIMASRPAGSYGLTEADSDRIIAAADVAEARARAAVDAVDGINP